jgi:hypothetical protein
MAEEQPAAVPASGGDDGGEEPPTKKVRTEGGGGDERPVKPDEEFKAGANAEDDEATLDEEEFEQGGAANQAEETSALAAEAEMPLDQLLAMYGLSKDQLEGDAPGLRDDEDEDEDEDEEEEEEEEEEAVDVDEETATRAAKGWYDTLGPFASMYEMVVRDPSNSPSCVSILRGCPRTERESAHANVCPPQVGKAYKNSSTEWSIRYTVSPVGDNKPLDQEFFVRFYFERTKTRKGYKISVTKMNEDAAAEV